MQLAALHNENSAPKQASTKDGTLRWHVKFPKAQGGDPVTCPVMEGPTNGKSFKFICLHYKH